MLTTDCVFAQAADDENSRYLLKKVEKFVQKLLEIPLLKNCKANEPDFHIARKLCAFIFERIIFHGNNTIIHLCAKSNNPTLVESLLEMIHKFQLDELLNVQNYDQETAAHLACATNNVSLLRKLIEYDVDLNDVLDWNGNTPLHVAIGNSNNNCVSALLTTKSTATSDGKTNIDLSVFNDSGYTALHLATMKNNLNAVEMLTHKAIQTQCLSIFEDADMTHGQNALHIAIQSGAHDVAEYLIKNECISPLRMNKSGLTAIDLARNADATHLIKLMEQFEKVNDNGCIEADSSVENSTEFKDTNKVG